MKKRVVCLAFAALSLVVVAPSANAKGNGTSGGLTLLEAPGARAFALAEAFTAAKDDVAAFAYNPSTLKSLKTGQASFLYQKGLLDDAFSQFIVGSPWRRMGVGLSIGYYNGGDFQLSDGVTERSVTAQRDLVVALGIARGYGPWSVGFTGKYLSSELIETERATAFAADIGLNYEVSPRLQIGGALQNYGTQLKFVSEGDNLPRMFRIGASYNMLPQYGTVLMVDLQRMMNEGETRPGVGVETRVGPMALRAGYRHSSSAKQFTLGTGFAWGRSAFDYAFGLMNQDLDSSHKISYSFRFGGPGGGNQLFVRKGRSGNGKVALATPGTLGKSGAESAIRQPLTKRSVGRAAAKRMYTIRAGDNLAKIAKATYGDHRMWRTIYLANKHLISSPTEIEVGQKIALP